MPHNFNAPYYLNPDYHQNCQVYSRVLQQLQIGNKRCNVSQNDSWKCRNNMPHSNVYTSQNSHSNTKHKIRILSTKSHSGKLFSKAKIISDPKRQTFLSPCSNQSDHTTSNQSKTKTIRFLRVPKPQNSKPQSPKKTKSVGASKVQNKVIQEYYTQPENHCYDQSKKCIKSSVNQKCQPQFTVDYQDAKQIHKKNIFNSSTGQLLLKDLVGHRVVCLPQTQTANLQTQTESRKNFYFNIPKVTSIEVNDAAQIKKIQSKKSGQTSFFNGVKDDKEPEGYVSSFSRIILKDRPVALRSDELNLSNSIDEDSFGELSLMSNVQNRF